MLKLNKNTQEIGDAPLVLSTLYADLTYNQKSRFNYLQPIYNDETATAKLVSLLEGRGRNAWSCVLGKIDAINNARIAEQKYQDAIYDNFIIGEGYTSAVIIGMIGQIRRDLGLEPYLTRLKLNCENDLFSHFIVHDEERDIEISGTPVRQQIYIPVFKLKPED